MELIAKEQTEIKLQINKVNELIKVLNRYTDILNKTDLKVTINDIIQMSYDRQLYINKVFKMELEKICDTFAQDYDIISKMDLTPYSKMFQDMANKKCQPLYELSKEVSRIAYWGDKVYLDYVEITDNIASPKLNFEDDITEHYSHYCTNKTQETITKLLKEIQATLNKADKMGFSSYELYYLINPRDKELDFRQIEKIN